ncbi:hypothetical protein I0C86_41345 [Plantactinospora sp. S1510]|uniref:Uncharacterized protein n=1 Tax=Plantactinospora alkalitolerans TaxID=2789879 RepID=A0ABS0HAD4_9ACTN|nr:hypothetical protein [Plantactinospora alkalitolerans]MBF9135299.1 hypothetical protein [Plantactinospora alkalitolerans]
MTPEDLEDGLATKVDLSDYTGHGVILAGADEGVPGELEAGADGTSLVADASEPLGLRWQTTALFGNVLSWTGTDYVPTPLKTDTSKPRIFVGPVDPAVATGVVLNTDDWFDTWVGSG